MPGISTSSVLNSKRLHITSDYTKCIQSQAVDQPISTCSPAESISISPTQFPPLSTGPLIQILAPAPRLESFDLPPYFSPTTPSQTTVDSLSSLSQLHVRVPAFSPLMPIPSIVSGPFTIYAPRPERLSNPPQVPEMISKVIEDPKRGLIDRYGKSLQFQRRELRQWERGYWQMDLSGWGDQKKKIFFWNNVVDNVSKGRWGMVNVSLGTEESPGRYDGLDVEKMNPSLKSEFERKGNIVKIYCWGGAVKYIWAALYTFSWKRMDGAQWIDSHGEPVIICKV
ncbi:hypothetical protein EDC01DRAFT_629423 [Geopyxis carbonaria]|nr:hypothetical protein EDC01DRAFT_629423 [Geopyxis carbonaria]